MRENHTSRCQECHFYCQSMCIHKNPSIEKRPFGFPFKYNPKRIQCHSYEKKSIDDEITWEHM